MSLLQYSRRAALIASAIGCCILAGCEGRSIVDDNPVFGAAPPRRSLVNQSTVAAADSDSDRSDSVIRLIGSSSASLDLDDGNTVVAEINGSPVFLDDVVGGLRLKLQAASEVPETERQRILLQRLRNALPGRIDEEVILSELRRRIPADRQEMIRGQLEPGFRSFVDGIKKDQNLSSDEQLEELLAGEGINLSILRENFFRANMAQGFLTTLAEVSEEVDRSEMVRWYRDNIDQFTPVESVDYREVVVRFNRYGSRGEAEQVMKEVVRRLQSGDDFGAVAAAHSDSLSADKQGLQEGLRRGSLADSELEETLFALAPGEMTQVYVRDDRFEVFRVERHVRPVPQPFAEVQQQVQQAIRQTRLQEGRSRALKELRERSTIRSLLDAES